MRVEEWEKWRKEGLLPIILDGGQATEFEGQGFDLSVGSLWSARLINDAPALVRSVARSYLEAGADIVSSVTYQATLEGLVSNLSVSEDEAKTLLRRGVTLVGTARDKFWNDVGLRAQGRKRKPLVAGSIGSYGAFLADGSEYRGSYGLAIAQLEAFHKRRAKIVADAGADILAFETIPDALEAEAITRLMTNNPTLRTVPFWISFVCADENHLACGTSLSQLSELIINTNAWAKNCIALGTNCIHPSLALQLVPSLRRTLQVTMQKVDPDNRWPISTVCYPNSGEQWSRSKGWNSVENLPVTEWASLVRKTGADIVGGCCRSTPTHIASLCRAS